MEMRNQDDAFIHVQPGCYPVTTHAILRLCERWPETILATLDLTKIRVPLDAKMIGYDPSTSASYLQVPGTPMVAVVEQSIVRTFLSLESARYKLQLHGFWFGGPRGPLAA